MNASCLLAVVIAAGFVGAACAPGLPGDDVLRVQGTLEGPGGNVDVAFDDARSKGEWWPCESRFTAQSCVDGDGGSFHVNVFVGRPELKGIDELGGNDCVVEGEPQGAFEILRAGSGRPSVIGEDVSAFVVIASDVDGNGSADLDVADETLGTAVVESGTMETTRLAEFDEVFAFRLTGKTSDDHDVVIEFFGDMTNPAVLPGLEPATTCVAD